MSARPSIGKVNRGWGPASSEGPAATKDAAVSGDRRQPPWTDWIGVPPVYIVGCPRSGTTLLRVILSAHPHISVSAEGAYIYHLRPRLASYGDLSDPRRLEALHRDLQPFLEQEKFLTLPPFADLLAWVERFGPGMGSLLTFYGTWEARALGKERLLWWGDNAPYHVYHIPYFDSLFPRAKFILMIRDPRDTCASSKASFPWHWFERAVGEWRLSVLEGMLAREHLGPGRVRVVKYEEFVAHPETQLEGICAFLSVERSREMLAYPDSELARTLSQLGHHRNLLKPLFPTSIGRYRQVLTAEEIATIEGSLCSPMRYLGYLSGQEYEAISTERLDLGNVKEGERHELRRQS